MGLRMGRIKRITTAFYGTATSLYGTATSPPHIASRISWQRWHHSYMSTTKQSEWGVKEMASSMSIRGKMARASRRDSNTDPETLRALERDYRAARFEEIVAREVRKIEPLTDEQIRRISQVMRGQAAK